MHTYFKSDFSQNSFESRRSNLLVSRNSIAMSQKLQIGIVDNHKSVPTALFFMRCCLNITIPTSEVWEPISFLIFFRKLELMCELKLLFVFRMSPVSPLTLALWFWNHTCTTRTLSPVSAARDSRTYRVNKDKPLIKTMSVYFYPFTEAALSWFAFL